MKTPTNDTDFGHMMAAAWTILGGIMLFFAESTGEVALFLIVLVDIYLVWVISILARRAVARSNKDELEANSLSAWLPKVTTGLVYWLVLTLGVWLLFARVYLDFSSGVSLSSTDALMSIVPTITTSGLVIGKGIQLFLQCNYVLSSAIMAGPLLGRLN